MNNAEMTSSRECAIRTSKGNLFLRLALAQRYILALR